MKMPFIFQVRLICPDCNTILHDRFGAKRVYIKAKGLSALEMECLNCDKYFIIKLEITSKQI